MMERSREARAWSARKCITDEEGKRVPGAVSIGFLCHEINPSSSKGFAANTVWGGGVLVH